MTTPEQPFAAEFVARIANELFQAVTVPALATDAGEHAAQNPATTADITSTSVAPVPGLGVAQAYNLSAVDLASFDDGGYMAALDDLDLRLVSEVPEAGDEPGQIPDAQFLAQKLGEVPTQFPDVLAEAGGEHPYLRGQFDAAHARLGGDGVDGSGPPDAPTQAVPADAAAETALLQGHLDDLGGEPDAGYRPTLAPAEPPAPDIAPTTTGFDAERIRADFPILSERVHGRRLVWLDNGATTQKPRQVIDRLTYFYEHENSNVHRTAHTLAGRATDAYEGARDKVRDFINAGSSDEIVWVRGTTEGINLVAGTFGEQQVGEGDEVLISHLEHHANIVPWQMLCWRKGATLRVIPVDDSGQIILSEYERLISGRTRIVAFTHVSNALGTVTPAKEMVEIAHRHGVPVLIDGAQGVLHMPVDVQDLDCDFYVFSGHKLFAPTGIGVVYGKRTILADMPPWQGGGNMIDQVHFDHTTFQAPPWRFEAGTGSIADAVGLGEAVDYLQRIGMDHVQAAERELLAYGTQGLLTVPGLCIYGHAEHKAGVLSFNIEGHDPVEAGAHLDQEGIAVRAGHHCAQPILRRFGVEATVRAALALYNTREDLDRLVDALHRMVTGTPRV